MSEKVKKGRLKVAGVMALVLLSSLILLGVFEITVGAWRNRIDFIGAGKRWSADGSRYSVICTYMEHSNGVSEDQLSQWEYMINSALTEASVSAPDGARPWVWSASFDAQLNVNGVKGSTAADVTVCAGDFFVFHSLDFVYGSGFSTDGTNPMGVVLDEEMAWKLFGAENIVGMTFTSGNNEYTVTGVVKPKTDKGPYGYTYGTKPRMYMSYDGYAKNAEGSFTTYEAALPNPVGGFAVNIFDSVVKTNEDTSEKIEATERFSIKSRYANMKELQYSLIRQNKIGYPYWENEARIYDYRSAVLMIWEIVVAVIGIVALAAAIVLTAVSGYSPIVTVKNIIRKAKESLKKKYGKKEVIQ